MVEGVLPYDRIEALREHVIQGHNRALNEYADREQAGAVMMPFPNVTMGITALRMLSEFSPENGATRVVPKNHLDPRNPPELHDDVDPAAPIPGEIRSSHVPRPVQIP